MTSIRMRLAAAGLVAITLLSATAAVAPAALAQDDERTHEQRREDRLARLEERLGEAVESGRITTERADEIRARIEEGIARGEARRADRQAKAEELAGVLGTTVEELRDAHKAGQSLADVATANGVAVDDVIDHLTEQASERLAQAVEDGRVDAARVAEIEATLEERITARVNGEGPERDGPRRGFRRPGHLRPGG